MHAARKAMRETRNHLAVVTAGGTGSGTQPAGVIGVVTLSDVLRRLFLEPSTAAA